MLAAARAATGLAVVTEVMATEDVALVARYADVLQVGARNMQNYRLLEPSGKGGKPVLLNRGPSATMEELLLAAEYILDAGNPDVMLCERGIRTFEIAHPLHAAPGFGRLSARQDAFAGGRRSESRHRPHLPGSAHGRGQRGGRCGRLDPRSASRSRERAIRRISVLNFKQFAETMALCRRVAEGVGQKL